MMRIRGGTERDVGLLGAVERSAASVFRSVGLDRVADGEPTPVAALERVRAEGVLLVAVDGDDQPVGFLAAAEMDGDLFVHEISVAAEHQRGGTGTALIRAAEAEAVRRGLARVSLTTYRDIAWNGPFYARLGFREVDPAKAGPGHRAKLADEAASGHDPARRCVMAKTPTG